MASEDDVKWEDLNPFRLDQAGIDAVIDQAPGCAVTWVARNGRAMGVWVSHTVLDGQVWITTTGNRTKTLAWQRDPRTVAVFGVPKLGSVTLVGRVELSLDAELRRRFLVSLFPRFDHPQGVYDIWMEAMDTEDRYVGPIVAEKYITFDERKLGLQ